MCRALSLATEAISKTHVDMLQIRFFERVKLERGLKQLKGKAQRGHALSASEQQQIQKWEQDLQVCRSWCLCKQYQRHTSVNVCLQYVLHFPKGERYVSILKAAAEPEAQAKLDAERTRLKTVIKHQRAESAMLTEADEGLGQAEPPVGPSSVESWCYMPSQHDLLHFAKQSTSKHYLSPCRVCQFSQPCASG